MIIDMHTHLACLSDEYGSNLSETEKIELGIQELNVRRRQGTAAFFSSGTPGEWEFMQRLRKEYILSANTREKTELWNSFGIHPWHSDQFDPDDHMECFGSCDAVGEIGMDSVWCSVPLPIQRFVFERQLQIAADLKKPAVLHTKGQEREILEMIREFPGNVCVHWYSGDLDTFEEYRKLGCYFTLGPDLAEKCGTGTADEANGKFRKSRISADQEDRASKTLYQRMLREIPTDRLFLETDGISAVAWAYGTEQMSLTEIPAVLRENLCCMAAAKGITQSCLEERLARNLEEFLGKI